MAVRGPPDYHICFIVGSTHSFAFRLEGARPVSNFSVILIQLILVAVIVNQNGISFGPFLNLALQGSVIMGNSISSLLIM
jgi:hypothetical protein